MLRPIVPVRFIPLVVGTLALALVALAGPVRAAGPAVIVLPTTGEVDGVMAQYLADGIARAEREGAPAVIVELNTPGGSLDATQKITGAFLESPVPVIVWVSPAGGREPHDHRHRRLKERARDLLGRVQAAARRVELDDDRRRTLA